MALSATAELVGGPLDGQRTAVAVDAATGQPGPELRRVELEPMNLSRGVAAMPKPQDVRPVLIYLREPAPPGADVAWLYRYHGKI